MKDRIAFRRKVEETLATWNQSILAYNPDDYWMIASIYEYLEYYAYEHRLWNTSLALPLARGMHDGTYRKATIVKNGSTYRLPYVRHCLQVTSILAHLNIDISRDDEDILLASALCHDMIEDLPFHNGGRELTDDFHLNPRIYETVKLVTKRKDFTDEEERRHFEMIQNDRLALLVKLSDRSHNVEDLYNMSAWKVHEYVDETRKMIMPMCEFGFGHYPELETALGVLKDKINCLIQTAEVLVDRYEDRELELRHQLKEVRVENERLKSVLKHMWEETEDR